jgi:hypothetical protein
MVSNINIGTFQLLPKKTEFYTYSDFLNEYSREKENSEGIRIARYQESRYLLEEFKRLGISDNLKKYYYRFVTEITIVYDPYGTGRYKEAIIDDPLEVNKFQEGEPAEGYDNDGNHDEFWKGQGKIVDWREETSVFFLVKAL